MCSMNSIHDSMMQLNYTHIKALVILYSIQCIPEFAIHTAMYYTSCKCT